MTREEIAEYYFNTENQYSYADNIEQLKESIIPAVLYGYDEGYNQSRKENEELKHKIDFQTVEIESREVYLAQKERIILDQQEQIEKMKCCQNCNNCVLMEYGQLECVNEREINTYPCEKWELAE